MGSSPKTEIGADRGRLVNPFNCFTQSFEFDRSHGIQRFTKACPGMANQWD